MNISPVLIVVLHLQVLAADDNLNLDEMSVNENKYSRVINELAIDADRESYERSKRQSNAGSDEFYYVTQCTYDNIQKPEGPSIEILGKSLLSIDATLMAAKLVHLLVRFMPRPLFLKITEMSKVGLYPSDVLPDRVFEEFDDRPNVCRGQCGFRVQGSEAVDCSVWCTTTDYPFQPVPFSINYLWAYGNFSTLFVVETNIVCDGFNPVQSENMLIREFGFMMMAKILDNQTLQDIEDAYNAAVANSIWLQMKNKYEYFILGTLAWFNGVKSPVQLKGMACVNINRNGERLCSDAFEQRLYIKRKDNSLYNILNYVYNNNREYVNAETSTCTK